MNLNEQHAREASAEARKPQRTIADVYVQHMQGSSSPRLAELSITPGDTLAEALLRGASDQEDVDLSIDLWVHDELVRTGDVDVSELLMLRANAERAVATGAAGQSFERIATAEIRRHEEQESMRQQLDRPGPGPEPASAERTI